MSSKERLSSLIAHSTDADEPPPPPIAGQVPSSPTKPQNPNTQQGRKFTQHPIVSTILWLLGTEAQPLPVSAENDDKRSTLTWSDQRGGYLQEYLSTGQQPPGEGGGGYGNKEQEEGHTLKPSRKRVPTKYSRQELEQDERDSGSESGTPNWGFYISITPPMQEMFAKLANSPVPVPSDSDRERDRERGEGSSPKTSTSTSSPTSPPTI